MLAVNLLAYQVLSLTQTPTPTPSPDQNSTGAEFGKAGPPGLVIVLLLLIGVVFLIRSMNRHMRKLPASFDTEPAGPDPAATDPAVATSKPKGTAE